MGLALSDAVGGGDDGTAILTTAIVLGVGAALSGPFIAYEITDHDARQRGAPSTPISIRPSLRIGPDGGMLVVAGAI